MVVGGGGGPGFDPSNPITAVIALVIMIIAAYFIVTKVL